jgi:hypothetical protein
LLKLFFKKYGKNPTIEDFNINNNLPKYGVIRNKFGNLTEALKMADLEVKEKIKLSKNDMVKIIDDYQNGILIKEIAKKFNTDETRILFELRKNNIPTKTNRWTKEKIKKLKEIYPNSSWDIILKELSPFRKEDITTKAYKLNIKRECFGIVMKKKVFLRKTMVKFQ